MVFNLFAMEAEAILYITESNEIGRQFFRTVRSLFHFGKHDIMHCLNVRGSSLLS